MKQGYRRYVYKSDVGLIGRAEQIKEYLDEKFSNVSVDTDLIETTIENTINTSIDKVNCGICGINNHIECAKNEIINNMGTCKPCVCNLATKEDVQNAVKEVNAHTDEKFDEVDFIKQFSDLNEQIKNVKS